MIEPVAESSPELVGRVAVFTAPGEIDIQHHAVPRPGSREVLVRLHACALCTMEQRLWHGKQTDYPINPGHEAAGQIVDAHPDATGDAPIGSRVAIAFLDRCMTCPHCRRGDTQLCSGKLRGRSAGQLRRIGGLADYAIVPAWKVFPMPDDRAFAEIALCEPVACVVHSVKRAELRFADDVLVIGGGMMGHLHVLVARLRGARVFVSEPDPVKRALAIEHGASGAFKPTETVAAIHRLTNGHGADAVFVTHGTRETEEQAAAAVASGGRIIYYGSFSAEIPTATAPREIHNRETILDGARGQTLEDWHEATRLVGHGIVGVRHLISERFSLDRVAQALQRATDPDTFRVVVEP